MIGKFYTIQSPYITFYGVITTNDIGVCVTISANGNTFRLLFFDKNFEANFKITELIEFEF